MFVGRPRHLALVHGILKVNHSGGLLCLLSKLQARMEVLASDKRPSLFIPIYNVNYKCFILFAEAKEEKVFSWRHFKILTYSRNRYFVSFFHIIGSGHLLR
jgi:hypothetical protein